MKEKAGYEINLYVMLNFSKSGGEHCTFTQPSRQMFVWWIAGFIFRPDLRFRQQARHERMSQARGSGLAKQTSCLSAGFKSASCAHTMIQSQAREVCICVCESKGGRTFKRNCFNCLFNMTTEHPRCPCPS